VSTIEKLAAEHGDNGAVQVIGGTVLAAAGKPEDALALLSRQEGNRMCSLAPCFGVSWALG
jgi:coatomer protein complex subunit epsilon